MVLKEFDVFEDLEEAKSSPKIKKVGIISENVKMFEGTFRLADYDEMSYIREESTVINQRNAMGMLWMKLYRKMVLARLCVEWNLVEEIVGDGESEIVPLQINEETAGRMNEQILVEIVNRWAKKIGFIR